jgi:hypothetical protein
VSVNGIAPTTIDVDADAVWAGLAESFTVTAKLNVPLAAGVPEIRPVDADMERPLGNWPEVIDHV